MELVPASLSLQVLSEYILFASFLCNRRLAIALEIAKLWRHHENLAQTRAIALYTPIFKQSPFLNKFSWKDGIGPSLFISSRSFRLYLNCFSFMQQETRNCIGNCWTIKASIESRPDQSDCDAYPHLEAVTISKQIQLEGWDWAQPLHLFEFFQNLSYLVHFYATGDSQLHWKLLNREVTMRISPKPAIAMHTPIFNQSPFLNEFSWKDGIGPSLFISLSSFRIYLIWFISMQRETRNCIVNPWTIKASIESRPDQRDCDAYPHL